MSKRRRYIAWAAGGVTVLAGAGVTAYATVSTPTLSNTSAAARPKPAVFTGNAFDACTAPSLAAMKAWRTSSTYRGAAVYIGGKNRGCAQPNLTASWVKSVDAVGWKLIPLYVGAQPPCQTSTLNEKMTTTNAASLGATDGNDAIAKAAALNMKPGSALYLDMESYDITNTACNTAVIAYVKAWDHALHAKGYWAGFYGFSTTSAKAVVNTTNHSEIPDVLWYAKYDNVNSTTTGFPFDATRWTGHRRGHQYAVNAKVSHGGYTITLDRDAWDAPVAIIAK
ncbi:glycoside hydrolase domain-containing protein [Streptomyces sp. NBC_01465]|uniref:glycoside hydrolase domain-containing protein n=1 Tax=Streptomyces sp. NBC_01465 TaxID=2903878 RepID=UPI002E300644|nr:glycoside hydrolase domain-containing protein [Streptomyces sp. NBC_01465]